MHVFMLFTGKALAALFSCCIQGELFVCVWFSSKYSSFIYSIQCGQRLSKVPWKYTHALVFVWWVSWQNSINRTLMKANNYHVVTTTMVNGLFEVTSITLTVKRLLTCLIYLVWGNWKKSAVLFCAYSEDRLFLNSL